jgi:uncharacterized cupin superfamily protein
MRMNDSAERPIMNLDEVEFTSLRERARKRGQNEPPAGFDAKLGPIGEKIGARKLGYNITVIPPGKSAFPLHSHRVNEEMFFVLEGEGELRLGDAVHPLRAGDVIACPVGDASTAHQLRNSGSGELKFLAVSTMEYPEVCEYPDSNKYLVRTGFAADDFVIIGRRGEALDYWDSEQ